MDFEIQPFRTKSTGSTLFSFQRISGMFFFVFVLIFTSLALSQGRPVQWRAAGPQYLTLEVYLRWERESFEKGVLVDPELHPGEKS